MGFLPINKRRQNLQLFAGLASSQLPRASAHILNIHELLLGYRRNNQMLSKNINHLVLDTKVNEITKIPNLPS
jgi:hypothetical protein